MHSSVKLRVHMGFETVDSFGICSFVHLQKRVSYFHTRETASEDTEVSGKLGVAAGTSSKVIV